MLLDITVIILPSGELQQWIICVYMYVLVTVRGLFFFWGHVLVC